MSLKEDLISASVEKAAPAAVQSVDSSTLQSYANAYEK